MNTAADRFDIVVVGGGPSGATCAADLAAGGLKVCLLDRGGRIKPCGGAIPPIVLSEFKLPESLLVARVTCARMVAPSRVSVDMPIENGFVGMVDREQFDEWLRVRAATLGAERRCGDVTGVARDAQGQPLVEYRNADQQLVTLATRLVIGADGANSRIARQCIAGAHRGRFVAAYHEIVRSPALESDRYARQRCDVYYQGEVSPDFYGWIFPHGDTISIGVGSARKGFSLRAATTRLRERCDLGACETVRREGAPIPMKPLPRWDNGRDVLLAGDAAGVVAPASGEGIYYAMLSGRMAASAAAACLATGEARQLRRARREFMKCHGRVFWVLGIMQHFWYSSDRRRERFVSICGDRDVQRLTWEAYLHKRLVRGRPFQHARIFLKDMAHLLGLART